MSERQRKAAYWQDAPMPREQLVLFSSTLEERIPEDHPVRMLDELLDRLEWKEWECDYHGSRRCRTGMTLGLDSLQPEETLGSLAQGTPTTRHTNETHRQLSYLRGNRQRQNSRHQEFTDRRGSPAHSNGTLKRSGPRHILININLRTLFKLAASRPAFLCVFCAEAGRLAVVNLRR